jgi:hypothetical protein
MSDSTAVFKVIVQRPPPRPSPFQGEGDQRDQGRENREIRPHRANHCRTWLFMVVIRAGHSSAKILAGETT